MKTNPFSLATDGSNDEGLIKMNPLLVRFFDVNRGGVHVQLLDMCCSKSSTAEALFTKMSDALLENRIDWSGCIGISMDNTSVNMGRHNSIKTRIMQVNNSIYINGCPCHIVHNTAMKGSEKFNVECGFDVEDLLVDLFYWFDKSTKRKVELEEFCSFCDQDYRKIVKHVNTRWLSLECAVTRTLRMYQALCSYFLSQEAQPNRLERLIEWFTDPMTEVYLYFYQYALQSFVNFNKYLQREDPLISKLHDEINRFLKRIA